MWIADPWDAAYLKTEAGILLQTAEILEAEGFMDVDDEFARPSAELLRKGAAFEGGPPPKAIRGEQKTWDLFVSHASEDKEAFVRPLVERLRLEGLSVWYDELTLTLGDSLRQKIDEGLVASRYAVVVLSNAFFAKDWPRKELDGLNALEVDGRKVILPIWHEVSQSRCGSVLPDPGGPPGCALIGGHGHGCQKNPGSCSPGDRSRSTSTGGGVLRRGLIRRVARSRGVLEPTEAAAGHSDLQSDSIKASF